MLSEASALSFGGTSTASHRTEGLRRRPEEIRGLDEDTDLLARAATRLQWKPRRVLCVDEIRTDLLGIMRAVHTLREISQD